MPLAHRSQTPIGRFVAVRSPNPAGRAGPTRCPPTPTPTPVPTATPCDTTSTTGLYSKGSAQADKDNATDYNQGLADGAANAADAPRITRKSSRVSAWVIPTDEDLMIARHVYDTLFATTAS